MPSGYNRAKRVGVLIQEELSRILLKETGDPRLKSVTITEVKMSKDLRIAKIYFTTMGNKQEKTKSLTALKKAGGYLKHQMGEKLELRYMPELFFYIDESLEYGEHIENLLKEVLKDDK
ncbi:MAG: 30S ribosome-binding factor RbfA [Deltaproteobacteria bacterium]|nr:30S ribosome-binding factor RbfA [Deltaproteobacteria bacterium]